MTVASGGPFNELFESEKRDFFAAMALVGILAAPSDVLSQDLGPNCRANPALAAEWAYQFADAMLMAKGKSR